MRKGLTLTLTVVVALIATQAWALAPTIGSIPSPVVGDAETASPANGFVYPDAFNLADYVQDDATASTDIIWSYEIVGTAKYAINGVPSLVSPTLADLVTGGASGANQINQVLNGEVDPDSNPATLTIRNIHLSPLSGTPVAPGSTGVLDAETQAVTFYASDGTTATYPGGPAGHEPKTVFFYTESGGDDHLSGGGERVLTKTFTTLQGFVSVNEANITFSTNSSTALCMDTPLTGINFGEWVGPYGDLQLVKNSVYHIRAMINGSQATAGAVPFWDFYLQNTTGTVGFNLYGFDSYFLDNNGGANAALSGGPTPFDIWWCPIGVTTPQWNVDTDGSTAGPFAPAGAADKDGRLVFRMLDVNNSPGITADNDFGSLCMTELTIDRFDIGTVKVLDTPFEATTITDSASGGNSVVDTYDTVTVSYASGAVTLTPITSSLPLTYAQVVPGDTNNDTGDPATIVDNYPVPRDPQTLYRITMNMTATANPPGQVWISADSPTNEANYESFATGALNLSGMPNSTAQDFVAFYWSQYGTAAADYGGGATPSQFQAFRPKLVIGSNGSLTFPATDNTGSVTLNSMKVDKVTF